MPKKYKLLSQIKKEEEEAYNSITTIAHSKNNITRYLELDIRMFAESVVDQT